MKINIEFEIGENYKEWIAIAVPILSTLAIVLTYVLVVI